ncbi:hypothetical protein, partial [Streptomyces sp. WM4235]|uniref:hypothetical protein n=1 Tax=Streptomyces sp. WM4235 TaxID=1415551 RepID=UPI001F2633E3
MPATNAQLTLLPVSCARGAAAAAAGVAGVAASGEADAAGLGFAALALELAVGPACGVALVCGAVLVFGVGVA